MSNPDPSDAAAIAGERDRHIDHKQHSSSGETRRRQAAIVVAGGSTAVLLWLLWAGPTPQHKVEHTAVRQTAVFEPAMEKPAPKELPRLAAMTDIKPAAVIEPPPPAPPPPDPMLEASRKAPVLAVSKRESASSRTSAITTGTLTPETEADDKGQFERRLKPPKLEGVRAGLLGNPNFVVPQGTAIPCTLETAMQSDQPGFVSCVIPRDVLGANGRVVLLERGTQVTGEYRGGLKQGQVRLHVLWSRARSSAGVVVDLGSPATDPLGRAGVGGILRPQAIERRWSGLFLRGPLSDASLDERVDEAIEAILLLVVFGRVHPAEGRGADLRQRCSSELASAQSPTGDLVAEQGCCSVVGPYRDMRIAFVGKRLQKLLAVRFEPIRRDFGCCGLLGCPGHGVSFRWLEGAKTHGRGSAREVGESDSCGQPSRHS
jgi:type IV secretion system protein VirB10